MRVLIITQYYKPEPIPKPVELAQELKRLGDDVTVITGFPDYPSGVLYSGYSLGLVREEVVDGIRVIRTYEYPYHGNRALGRLANYLSFMISAPLGALFIPSVDVIYVWHPPLTIGIAAWVISRLYNAPFVYDVQDIWPEAVVLSGMLRPGLIVRLLTHLERFVYSKANQLIVVTEGARLNLLSKGVEPGKVRALPHWINSETFASGTDADRVKTRLQYGWTNRFIIVFAGNIGLVQGLGTLIEAAMLLRSRINIRLIFIGDGADRRRLEALAVANGLSESVEFIDRQPIEAIAQFLNAADTLVVHLRYSELSNYVIPTKTLAYMASAKPLIMAMRGAAALLVGEAKAGFVVEPEDAKALASAVVEMSEMSEKDRTDMGRRGATYLQKHFSKAVVLPEYHSLLLRAYLESRQCVLL